MGMTIDESLSNLKELQKDYKQFYDDVWQDPEAYGIMAESLKVAIETMRKYQMFQADYENRLKADMVAMFEELNLEIDEMFARRIDYTVDKIQDLIQQKINALKEASDA